MARTIGIVSGKGGVGKTTVAINLASALMSFDVSAIVVDADIKMCGASLHLNMYNYPITLNNVLKENMNIFDAIYTHTSGIKVVPSSLFSEQVSLEALPKILSNPNLENNIIILDSPPGIGDDLIPVLNSCKEIIPIVTPDIPSVADTVKIVDFAEELGVRSSGIVVNRYIKGMKNQLRVEEIEEIFEVPILGVIMEDEEIRRSVNERTTSFFLNPNSKSSLTFKQIAAKILGYPYRQKEGFLRRLFPF